MNFKRKKTKLAYILGMFFLLFCGNSYGANEILLSIEGVNGDSQIEGYQDFIPIEDTNFSIEKKAKAYDFEFTKKLDSSSSALINAAISKATFPSAKIVFLQSNGGPFTEYLTITITNPRVSKFSTSGGPDERPSENFTLHGILSEYNYTP